MSAPELVAPHPAFDLSCASRADLPDVRRLHARFHVDSIDATEMADGFVTTAFSDQQWLEMCDQAGRFLGRAKSRLL